VLNHLIPEGIRKAFRQVRHAVDVRAGARLLFCSGQLGISPDDRILESAEEQAVLCFDRFQCSMIEVNEPRVATLPPRRP